MKIIIGVHHFPPRYTGGAEWQAFRTATALRERGFDVRAICVERIDAEPVAGLTWQDTAYGGVPVRRLSLNMRAAPDPRRWEYDNAWIGEHLDKWLTDERPDLFHLFSGYLLSGRALQAAQRLGIATVVTLTDFWFLCRRLTMLRSDGHLSQPPINAALCARCLGEERRSYRWLGRVAPRLMQAYWHRQARAATYVQLRSAFLRQALDDTDAIISPSEFLRSVYVAAGFRPERITFVRQGLEGTEAPPAALAKTASPKLRIGYLGQIAPVKGIHILVEAIRRIPSNDLMVQIYGDTRHQPQYAAHLRKLIGTDSRIHLAGAYQGPNEMAQVLSEVDVIVVPSLWYENSPNVILEAFAHRTPVVASDIGGMAEMVNHDRNGLLFRLGEADDLAGQLRRLLEEPGLRARLCTGIPPVKRAAQEMDELEAVYRQALVHRARLPAESPHGSTIPVA